MSDEATGSALAHTEPPAPTTSMEMAFALIKGGANLESVKEMMALSRELAADEARRSFDEALSAAKAEIPPILKNREVDFTSAKGRTNYRHEDMGQIARTVDPILAAHGLSYRFRTEQQDGGAIRVTCIVAHRRGHSEQNSLQAPRDESGNKNGIQGIGSTITYLQRYTLKAALGLAASNDDDGRTSGHSDDEELITDAQRIELVKLIEEVGGSVAVFCQYFHIESIAAVPASQFERAKAAVEAKRPKGEAK